MPRITLYVPEELKDRMDAIGEIANWSSIAQAAFKEAVALNALRRNPSDMEQIIERLRVSKARVDREREGAGREFGSIWAQQVSEYDELRRISNWTRIKEVPVPFTVEALKAIMDPKQTMDRYAWHDFWQRHGDGEVSDAFAKGFIMAAAEVFEEVEPHI
ncbi:MAG TPA: hypothetical protein VFC56_06270 [Stellaceae bacterium]|nr:hypothetical protein [Stellaceae bacterium]